MWDQEAHVAGVAIVLRGFETLQLGEYRWIHAGVEDAIGVGVVSRHTRHHVGDDQGLEMCLMREGVLESQQASPRMSEQIEVVALEPQCLAHLLDLVDEAGGLPELRRLGLIAVMGAELVVVVVLDARTREVAVERFQVFVGEAGSAMEEEQLDSRVVADAFRPHPEGVCRRGHRDHLHPASEDVVPPGVVEVGRRRLLRRCWGVRATPDGEHAASSSQTRDDPTPHAHRIPCPSRAPR